MDCPRVCVVDNSPTIRETIAIVLGDGYRVECLTPDEYLRHPPPRSEFDLLIIGADALPPESLRLLADGPPVLWLDSRSGPPVSPGRQWPAVLRQFTPEDLREQVQTLLTTRPPSPPALSAWSIIDYPILPKEATELARQAARTHFPVLICGEPGTGKARLARAIHSLGHNGRFVPLSATGCTMATLQRAAGIAPGNLTVFVGDVSGLDVEGQHLLSELLDCGGLQSQLSWHHVRVICATNQDLNGLARTRGFDKELFYRLSVFPITLPPLRERTDDIAGLATYLAETLARSLSAEPVHFTARATQRLVRYLWFGNLAELEAVLTRTVALTPGGTIDAEDLLFGYGRIVPRRREDSRPAVRPVTPAVDAEGTVDLIINELAHEFKNPMVTIKTVAQHLERLLADPSGREQVARLTGEAVDRMDRALENLLQFTRFRAPAPHEIPLNALLAPCLTDLTPQLTERRVVLDYRPPKPFSVFVDAAQLVYAFDNLLRVIARDLEEGQTLSIRTATVPAAVTFEFARTGPSVGEKLSDLLGHAHNGDAAAPPIGLVLAKALIERNGGRIEIHSPAGTTRITVQLPSREEMAPNDGTATSFSS